MSRSHSLIIVNFHKPYPQFGFMKWTCRHAPCWEPSTAFFSQVASCPTWTSSVPGAPNVPKTPGWTPWSVRIPILTRPVGQPKGRHRLTMTVDGSCLIRSTKMMKHELWCWESNPVLYLSHYLSNQRRNDPFFRGISMVPGGRWSWT